MDLSLLFSLNEVVASRGRSQRFAPVGDCSTVAQYPQQEITGAPTAREAVNTDWARLIDVPLRDVRNLPHEPLGALEVLAFAHGGSTLAHVVRFVPNCLCCYALLSRCLSGAVFKERVDAHLEDVESHMPSAMLDFYMSVPFVLHETSAPDFVLSRLAVSQWVRDLTTEGIEPNPGPHPLFVLFIETFLGSLVSALLTIHVFTPDRKSVV